MSTDVKLEDLQSQGEKSLSFVQSFVPEGQSWTETAKATDVRQSCKQKL